MQRLENSADEHWFESAHWVPIKQLTAEGATADIATRFLERELVRPIEVADRGQIGSISGVFGTSEKYSFCQLGPSEGIRPRSGAEDEAEGRVLESTLDREHGGHEGSEHVPLGAPGVTGSK